MRILNDPVATQQSYMLVPACRPLHRSGLDTVVSGLSAATQLVHQQPSVSRLVLCSLDALSTIAAATA